MRLRSFMVPMQPKLTGKSRSQGGPRKTSIPPEGVLRGAMENKYLSLGPSGRCLRPLLAHALRILVNRLTELLSGESKRDVTDRMDPAGK